MRLVLVEAGGVGIGSSCPVQAGQGARLGGLVRVQAVQHLVEVGAGEAPVEGGGGGVVTGSKAISRWRRALRSAKSAGLMTLRWMIENTVRGLEALDHCGVGLTATLAHRLQTIARSGGLEVVEHRRHEP